MTPGLRLLWLLALGALLALVVAYDATAILAAVAGVGWGLVLICGLRLVPLVLHTLGWAVLLPLSLRRPLAQLAVLRWYGESVSTLLPVAQVGGHLLRGHLHAAQGVPHPQATAGVVVDLTTEVAAQIAFAALAFTLLLANPGDGAVVASLLAGLALLSLLVLGFYQAQRRGLFATTVQAFERLLGRQVKRGKGYALALDRTVKRLYRRRALVRKAVALHLLAWVAGTAEVFMAALLLGHPLSWIDAFIIEGLLTAIRAAAFMVPGALGVQEGGLILLGGLVGLPAEAALALSLIKRVRELALGVPGILVWQRQVLAQALGSRAWAAGKARR